eukprot:608149-Prorocentrum_minimum.AAC.1
MAPPVSLDEKLGQLCGSELEQALRVQTKKGRETAMKAVKKVAMDTFSVVEEGVSHVLPMCHAKRVPLGVRCDDCVTPAGPSRRAV